MFKCSGKEGIPFILYVLRFLFSLFFQGDKTSQTVILNDKRSRKLVGYSKIKKRYQKSNLSLMKRNIIVCYKL